MMAVTLGFGFWFTGSPSSVRVLNEDRRRVRDLYDLTVQIESKNLQGPPATLGLIAVTAIDPFTGQPYEYRRVDDKRYQVCAQFTAPSLKASGAGLFWAHSAGRACFEMKLNGNAPAPPEYYQ
jgi:hypothetical protein